MHEDAPFGNIDVEVSVEQFTDQQLTEFMERHKDTVVTHYGLTGTMEEMNELEGELCTGSIEKRNDPKERAKMTVGMLVESGVKLSEEDKKIAEPLLKEIAIDKSKKESVAEPKKEANQIITNSDIEKVLEPATNVIGKISKPETIIDQPMKSKIVSEVIQRVLDEQQEYKVKAAEERSLDSVLVSRIDIHPETPISNNIEVKEVQERPVKGLVKNFDELKQDIETPHIPEPARAVLDVLPIVTVHENVESYRKTVDTFADKIEPKADDAVVRSHTPATQHENFDIEDEPEELGIELSESDINTYELDENSIVDAKEVVEPLTPEQQAEAIIATEFIKNDIVESQNLEPKQAEQVEVFVATMPILVREQLAAYIMDPEVLPEHVEHVETLTVSIAQIADRLHVLSMNIDVNMSPEDRDMEMAAIENALVIQYTELLEALGLPADEESIQTFIALVRSEKYDYQAVQQSNANDYDPMHERLGLRDSMSDRKQDARGGLHLFDSLAKLMVRQTADQA